MIPTDNSGKLWLHVLHKWQYRGDYYLDEWNGKLGVESMSPRVWYLKFVCHCGAIKSVEEKS